MKTCHIGACPTMVMLDNSLQHSTNTKTNTNSNTNTY